MELDVLDYDVIIGAYEKINIEFFCNAQADQSLAILSHCVHDMSSQDLLLRDSAYRLLLMFLDFCEKILNGELETNMGKWSEASIQNIVNYFFLKYMGEAMDKETSVKKVNISIYISCYIYIYNFLFVYCCYLQVWMDLLREMVLKLPNVFNLESYQVLRSEDAEKDFFNNIVHLQVSRSIHKQIC